MESTKLDIGITVFKNAVPLTLVTEINRKIDDQVQRKLKPDYRKLSHEDASDILFELRTLKSFNRIEKYHRRISRLNFLAAFDKDPPTDGTCYVRCAHSLSVSDSHNRHYDSYLMTILVPLKISYAEIDNGDLIVYKKKDCSVSTSRNLFRKIATKLDQQLPLSLRKRKTNYHLEKELCQRVTCEVGNVYFFNGYNLKHFNLSVGAGERRSLLLHAYDAGNSLGLSNFMRLFR